MQANERRFYTDFRPPRISDSPLYILFGLLSKLRGVRDRFSLIRAQLGEWGGGRGGTVSRDLVSIVSYHIKLHLNLIERSKITYKF